MTDRKISLKRIEWLMFIAVMIVLFFLTQTYFGTANYPLVYKINTFCIGAFLVVSVVTNHGVIKCKRLEIFSCGVVIVPYIVLFGISVLYYTIYHKITLSNMIYYNIQPILLCIMAIVVYNSFRMKALQGIIIAAAINYSVYIITCIVKYGPLSLFQAGSDTAASKLLEVHEITFVFGLFIIYLAFSGFFVKKNTKKKWIFLLLIFCLLGFKRILIVALILTYLLCVFVKKCKKPTLMIVISLVVIGVSLIWVYLCSSWNILAGISTAFGIDLKGRNWIYSNFYPYYDFSLSYVGAGVGYVQQLISEMSTMFLKGHSIGLHNDYMRLFIELGFIPYVLYFLLLLPIMIWKISKKVNMKAAMIYFALWLVTLMCIVTDNLLTYPNYMLSMFVLILTALNREGVLDNRID